MATVLDTLVVRLLLASDLTGFDEVESRVTKLKESLKSLAVRSFAVGASLTAPLAGITAELSKVDAAYNSLMGTTRKTKKEPPSSSDTSGSTATTCWMQSASATPPYASNSHPCARGKP